MQATGLFVVKDWIFLRKLVVYAMNRLYKHGEPAIGQGTNPYGRMKNKYFVTNEG